MSSADCLVLKLTCRYVKRYHNPWNYFYFTIYLKNKDPKDYTGQESYIDGMIKESNPGFFPKGRSAQLETSKRLHGEDVWQSGTRKPAVDATAGDVRLRHEVHSLAKKTEKLDDTMSEVLGQIGQIATAVAALSQMDKEVEKVWSLTIMAQSISELEDSDYEKVWNKYGASEPAQQAV